MRGDDTDLCHALAVLDVLGSVVDFVLDWVLKLTSATIANARECSKLPGALEPHRCREVEDIESLP